MPPVIKYVAHGLFPDRSQEDQELARELAKAWNNKYAAYGLFQQPDPPRSQADQELARELAKAWNKDRPKGSPFIIRVSK